MSALSSITVTAPMASVVSLPLEFRTSVRNVAMQASFTYGSGGTSATTWVQTSLDGGATFADVACFAFTTASSRLVANVSSQTPITTPVAATDGSLASNSVRDGVVGPLWRTKTTSTGTYTGTTLRVDIQGLTL